MFYQGKKVYGNVFGAKINFHGQAKGPTNNVDARNDGFGDALYWHFQFVENECTSIVVRKRNHWVKH